MKGLYVFNEKENKNKDKQIKRDLKQIKKEYIELLEKKYCMEKQNWLDI